jgi:hypothetical protein
MTDDELLRAAFGELRDADLREQPTFNAVLSRSAARRTSINASVMLRLAAAGIVIVVAGVTYKAVAVRTQRLTVPSDVVALTAWRPSTDALLPAQSSLLQSQPLLGKSILDLDTLTTGAVR